MVGKQHFSQTSKRAEIDTVPFKNSSKNYVQNNVSNKNRLPLSNCNLIPWIPCYCIAKAVFGLKMTLKVQPRPQSRILHADSAVILKDTLHKMDILKLT